MRNTVVKILILEDSVDDADMVILTLNKTKLSFISKVVDTKEAFLNTIQTDEPDIIISDYYLPGFEGLDALELVRKLNKDIPFIMITGSINEEVAIKCIENGAKDYVFKEHLARLGIAVFSCLEQKDANEKLKQNYKLLQKNFEMLIETITRVIEIRDPYTAGHQKRVAKLAVAIGTEMNLDTKRIEALSMAGMIHDIGKISVPSEILSKPGHLNEAEIMLIKMHPYIGATILQPIDFPWPIAEIVEQHHEKINGSGYGKGLKGDEILLEARILCVADVVEAIASHRPYRPALGIQAAINEIQNNKGVLYDAEVVDICVQLFSENKFSFDEYNM